MISMGFTFDGVHSSEMDLHTELVSIPLYSEPKTVYSDVPGCDGEENLSALNPKGRTCYRPRIIEFMCHGSIVPDSGINVPQAIEFILGHLIKEGDRQLILDDDRNTYYMAHVANLFNVEYETEDSFSFPLIFKCQPFRYSKVEESATGTEAVTLSNGGYYTDMVIQIHGTAPNGFTISSDKFPHKLLTVNTPLDNNTAVIDTAKADVTVNGISCLHSCEGEFFELAPTENTISVSGEAADVTISVTFRQRYL